MQYDRLHQEMQDIAVAGLIQRRPKMKASRSLPAIGLGARHAPKSRVCIYIPIYMIYESVVLRGDSHVNPFSLSLSLHYAVLHQV